MGVGIACRRCAFGASSASVSLGSNGGVPSGLGGIAGTASGRSGVLHNPYAIRCDTGRVPVIVAPMMQRNHRDLHLVCGFVLCRFLVRGMPLLLHMWDDGL
jgi:hypothetical protein